MMKFVLVKVTQVLHSPLFKISPAHDNDSKGEHKTKQLVHTQQLRKKQ